VIAAEAAKKKKKSCFLVFVLTYVFGTKGDLLKKKVDLKAMSLKSLPRTKF